MKNTLSLILTLLTSPALLAAPLDGIEWDKSAKDILPKLGKSGDFTLSPNAKSTGEKMVGGCTLNEEIAYQTWKITFIFDKKATKLGKILLIGTEGFDEQHWDSGALKSYYLFITNALKDKYGLGDRSVNTPHYDKLSKLVQSGDFYPLHSYKADGLIVTIGMHYDKQSKKIHAAYTLQKGAEDSAMGESGSDNPNVLGDASEWTDITHWESCPEATEFLTRVGVIKPKPAPTTTPEGDEGTITFTIDGDDDSEEPSEDETPSVDDDGSSDSSSDDTTDDTSDDSSDDSIDDSSDDSTASTPDTPTGTATVDTSLAEGDQNLLKSIIAMESSNSTDMLQALSDVAKAGNARALYQIAVYTSEGKGFTQDSAKAEKFYLAAAQLGYALALVRVDGEHDAALARIGYGPDESKALVDKIQEEAQGNSVSARFNLAIMYRYGYGIRKDIETARTLLEELKEQGDIQAEAMLKSAF